MKRIYMDNNATTAVRPEVLEAMLPFFKEQFGNPSSVHWAGRAVAGAVEKAREQVAKLINCSPAEIVFVSCGSEGDNMAILGTADALREKGNHIITTAVEHPAVLETCQFLEKRGFEVTYLPVDKHGMLDLAALEAAITDKTILISVMWANNETGNLYPDRRNRRHRPQIQGASAHRRGAGGRQGAGGRAGGRGRSAGRLRAQARRAERGRRHLYPPRHQADAD